jgi:hypothetical protein
MNRAFERRLAWVGMGVAMALAQATAIAGSGDVDKSGAAWWQWALSIPASSNPLLDTAGGDCMFGQSGSVWYLAGTFGAPTVTRSCTVPAGTAFFVPVINVVNINTPNVCGQGPANILASDLRDAVAPFIDGATNLSITVDGVSASNMRRIKSGVFALTLPEDNLFDGPCGGPGTVPAGVYSPAIDDGYYAQVNALSPGPHVVHIHAENTGAGFALDVTYNLTVVATINH